VGSELNDAQKGAGQDYRRPKIRDCGGVRWRVVQHDKSCSMDGICREERRRISLSVLEDLGFRISLRSHNILPVCDSTMQDGDVIFDASGVYCKFPGVENRSPKLFGFSFSLSLSSKRNYRIALTRGTIPRVSLCSGESCIL